MLGLRSLLILTYCNLYTRVPMVRKLCLINLFISLYVVAIKLRRTHLGTHTTTRGDQTEKRQNECACVRFIVYRLFFSSLLLCYYLLLLYNSTRPPLYDMRFSLGKSIDHKLLLLFTQCKKKKLRS